MPKTADCELFLLVDESGDFVVRKDAGELAEAYDEEIGNDAGQGRRVVRINLTVPLPDEIVLSGLVECVEKAELRAVGQTVLIKKEP